MAGDRAPRLKRPPPVTVQLMGDLTSWNSVKICIPGRRLSLLNAFGAAHPRFACWSIDRTERTLPFEFKSWGAGELANARVHFSKSARIRESVRSVRAVSGAVSRSSPKARRWYERAPLPYTTYYAHADCAGNARKCIHTTAGGYGTIIVIGRLG